MVMYFLLLTETEHVDFDNYYLNFEFICMILIYVCNNMNHTRWTKHFEKLLVSAWSRALGSNTY